MNRRITVLQTGALPLGYVTKVIWSGLRCSVSREEIELNQLILNWSGLRVSNEKTVNKRFLEAKSKECEKSEPRFTRRKILTHERTELEPIAEGYWRASMPLFRIISLIFCFLERITGLEPATSTLARWRSTK